MAPLGAHSQLNATYVALVERAKAGQEEDVETMLDVISRLQTKASQIRSIDLAIGAERGKVYR